MSFRTSRRTVLTTGLVLGASALGVASATAAPPLRPVRGPAGAGPIKK